MAAKRHNRINDQQDRFCRYYAQTLSVARAREKLEAETGETYTVAYCYKLLQKRHIQDRIEEIAQEAGAELDVEQKVILQEAASLAFSDISDLVGVSSLEDLAELPVHVRHAVKRIKRRQIFKNITRKVNGKNETTREVAGEEVMLELHGKDNALRLLAMAKKLIGVRGSVFDPEPDDPDDEEMVFTGCDIHLLEHK